MGLMPSCPEDVDNAVRAYIECQWAEGGLLYVCRHTCAALIYVMPGLRDKMHGSWKLCNTWEKLLPARRAAPITARICIGLAGAAIAVGQPRVALLLLLGFEGVLRSVELFCSS